jgi:DNA (cytosine-5)-methyltransferase 1
MDLLRKHLDLFSGIGGFALAARWAGIETIGFCEIDKYAQKVLEKNFPGVPIYEDVTKLDGSEFKDIFLITGGFPCQDISIAGKGAGIEGERSGLWSELFRIIGEVRPKYALVENVPALTFRGGTRVIGDLAKIGYDCEWQIVGANQVGALHRRNRIWIVAYSKYERCLLSKHERQSRYQKGISEGSGEDVAYSNSKRGCSRETNREDAEDVRESSRCEKHGYWVTEPSVGRVVNGLPHRVDRLKGLGNAIVPQVAYEIMKLLK